MSNNNINKNVALLKENGYHEITIIGQGGYGKVYKCLNKFNELVAVKILKANDFQEINNGFTEAFHLKGLNHLNIIKVYNAFLLNNNKLAIEMEYLDQGNLYNLIFEKKIYLSETIIYKILQQLCDALKYLKENNIIHRDIKLANILIKRLDLNNDDIETVLIDFGLIKFINSTYSFSQVVGSEGYLAPELKSYENYIPYSFKSDVFALGVTLYRLMSFDNQTDIHQLYLNLDDEEKAKNKLINNIKNNKKIKYSDRLINLVINMLEKQVIKRGNAGNVLDRILNREMIIDNIEDESNLIGFSNQFKFIGQLGSKGTNNNQFQNPYDILIHSGHIYVVDGDYKRISTFNINNNEFINKFEVDFYPTCITLDKTNNTFLIGSYGNNIVCRYSLDGVLQDKFQIMKHNSNPLAREISKISVYKFLAVSKVLVDESNGNLFVCYLNDSTIRKLSKDGKLIKEFTQNLRRPFDIFLNDRNQLIVSDSWDNCIKVFTKDGENVKFVGKKGNQEGEFDYPSGFTFDFVNRQYIICDEMNHRIQIFDENFEFIKSFDTGFNSRKVQIDYKTGLLYVVDTNNCCIKIYK